MRQKTAGIFPEIRRLLFLQMSVLIISALILGMASGFQAMLSTLMGGAVAFIPNLLFAVCSGRNDPKKQPRHVITAFYRGEIYKLALTGLLFVIAFRYSSLVLWSFFIGFVLVIMMVWFALLLRK